MHLKEKVTFTYLIFLIICLLIAFVPSVHYIGTEKNSIGSEYHVLIMDLLGDSLEKLFQICKRKFDLKTVCWLGV